MELFWAKGFVGASLGELEKRTGLRRSSLYLAFGDKRRLFERALDAYLQGHIDDTLAAMEADGAGLQEIEEYFSGLALWIRADPVRARHGCLLVNIMVELAAEDVAARKRCMAYRLRLHRAFRHAVEGAVADGNVTPARVDLDAELLVGVAVSLHLDVRLDPRATASRCDAIAAAVRTGGLL